MSLKNRFRKDIFLTKNLNVAPTALYTMIPMISAKHCMGFIAESDCISKVPLSGEYMYPPLDPHFELSEPQWLFYPTTSEGQDRLLKINLFLVNFLATYIG